MLIALGVFYFLVTGMANLSMLAARGDNGQMLILIFTTGFIAVPAMAISRAIKR